MKTLFWAFSHDVTVAILVSQTSPVGVELFSYVNALILFQQICIDAGHVSETAIGAAFCL